MTKSETEKYLKAFDKTKGNQPNVFHAPDELIEAVDVYLGDVFGQGPMTERERLLVRVGYTRNSRERRWSRITRFLPRIGSVLLSASALCVAISTTHPSWFQGLVVGVTLGALVFFFGGYFMDEVAPNTSPMEMSTAGEIVMMDRLSRTPNGWGPGCDRPEGV